MPGTTLNPVSLFAEFMVRNRMGTQEGQLMVFGHGQEKLREMVLPASDERVRERERSGGHYAYRTLAHLS